MKSTLKKNLSMVCAFTMLLGVVTIMPGARSRADATLVAGDELPATSGTYVLGESIEVTKEAVIPSGESVVIDLNGNTLHMGGSSRFYTIEGTLTVKDTSAQEAGCFIGNSSIPSGENGGIFLVKSGGILNLQNGSLLSGQVTESQASVLTNPKGLGGAVYCAGTFNMTGGSIKGCRAEAGGAVFVPQAGTFNMSGGELQLNTAVSAGGAICIGGSGNPGTLRLSGNAAIYENTCNHVYPIDAISPQKNASAAGGGICAVFSNNISVSGNVRISDNTCGYSPKDPRNNLYFTLPAAVLTISGSLGSGADIHFDRADSTLVSGMGEDAATYTSGLSGNGTAASFTCDRAEFSFVENDNGELILQDNSQQQQQEEVTLGISGYNVSLGGDIALNAYITVPEDKDVEKLSVSATYSYLVEKNGKNKTETNTFSFTSGDMTLDPDHGYKISVPVESACMTSEITFTLTYDGEELPDTYTTTVNNYANILMGKTSTSESDKDTLKKLLIYGLYAQKQFEINLSDLPSGNGVSYDPSGPSSYLVDSPFSGFTDPAHKDLYVGASVVFLTTNKIKFYFSEAVDFAVQYEDDGIWKEITPKKSGGYYVYILDGPYGIGFPATTYSQGFSIRIGSTVYPGCYSIVRYLESVMASSSTSQSMKNLAKAYYNFASSIY